MKEIGEALKEARESIGISIEEAANDLKLKPSQIKDIEAGNKDAFQDVFYLKYFIRDYSKYLGLNYAKKQIENKEKKEEKKVFSPYTYEAENKRKISPIVIYVLMILIVVVSCYFIISKLNDNNSSNNGDKIENVIK